MANRLEPINALDPGHNLWVIAYDPSSSWYQRLNWLTNFRLTANEIHVRPKMHPWLLKILETCEIQSPEIPLADPLLVPVAQWLPAEWLVMIPFHKEQDSHFVKQLQQIWEQLQKPSLRLFVPRSFASESWPPPGTEHWPSDMSLVFEN
jgi:hypothetical protein